MKTRAYPTLSEIDRAALQAFADAHGPGWKHELTDVYWYNARIWRDGPGSDVYGYRLHAIRNNYGPGWLHTVCDVVTTAAAPKKRKERRR